MPMHRRGHQRRLERIVGGVHVRLARDERVEQRTPLRGRHADRRAPEAVGQIELQPMRMLEQSSRDALMAARHRQQQRARAARVAHICPGGAPCPSR